MTVIELRGLALRPPRSRLVIAKRLLDAALVDARTELAKAVTPKTLRQREQLLDEAQAGLLAELAGYFAGMAERIVPVEKATAFDFDPDEDIDWKTEHRLLFAILEAWYERLGAQAFADVAEQLGVDIAFDLDGRNLAPVLEQLATRVTGITETSREAVRQVVATASERGYNLGQLVRGVADDSFGGLQGLVEAWGSANPEARATTIARTETATAYNLSTTAGYRDSGVVDSVRVFDGAGCGWLYHDDDDKADGSIRTLQEADEHPVSHPNCRRAFAAVVSG